MTDPYQILSLVCDALDVSPLQVLVRDRHAPKPLARQLTAWLLYRWVHLPQTQVAGLLGVTYSTVSYYVRNVERRRRNGELRGLCDSLARQV